MDREIGGVDWSAEWLGRLTYLSCRKSYDSEHLLASQTVVPRISLRLSTLGGQRTDEGCKKLALGWAKKPDKLGNYGDGS